MAKPNDCKKSGCQGKLILTTRFKNGRQYKCSVCGAYKDTWRRK